MKQALFTFQFVIFCYFFAFPQELFLEVEGGPGFPVGSFRSATGFPGGNVHPGVQVGGAVGIAFHESWSLGVRTIYSRNTMDIDPLVNIFPRPIWQNVSVLVSSKFSKPIFEYFHVEAEAQVGNMWRIRRSIERRFGPSPSGIAFGARLGAKYYFAEKLAYQLSFNFLNGMLNLRDTRTGGAQTQNVGLVLVNMGIAWEWK